MALVPVICLECGKHFTYDNKDKVGKRTATCSEECKKQREARQKRISYEKSKFRDICKVSPSVENCTHCEFPDCVRKYGNVTKEERKALEGIWGNKMNR